MRAVMVTDMEGVAGITNMNDWVYPEGYSYELGKQLLTQEVNAAIEGLMSQGFDEILVLDAHGQGGVDITNLDCRALYQRGFIGPYPMGITEEYDALCFVGQHAKAGTPFAHLPHTSSMEIIDQRINGISIGEFGMLVYMASSLGIPTIFASGDVALCQEASKLCTYIITSPVKRGLTPGTGNECNKKDYSERNTAAIHLTPHKSQDLIRQKATQAAKEFLASPNKFGKLFINLTPPFTVEIDVREELEDKQKMNSWTSYNLIEAFNLSWEFVKEL